MYFFVYAETITIPYKWSPFVRLARQRIAAIRAGSKMGCVELSNFHFCCAAIFCQPMKKFEFFGATRATRQRHSKTSSAGDEDGRKQGRHACALRFSRVSIAPVSRRSRVRIPLKPWIFFFFFSGFFFPIAQIGKFTATITLHFHRTANLLRLSLFFYYWQSHLPHGSANGLLCIQFACLVFQPCLKLVNIDLWIMF